MADLDDNGQPQIQGRFAAMVVCWLLGNGCLFSWNSMLTIEDYYVALFPRYHPARVLTLVYQPFALFTLIALSYNEAKINTRKRNLFGYTLFFLSTLLVLVLDLATSGKGGIATYIGICAISGAFGVADAHVQGGMIGDLSFMKPEFIQSFLAGLAASGALTSGLRLLTKAIFENSQNGLRKGAIMFFSISTLFELLCVFLYAVVFPKLPIVKFYRSKAASEGSKTVSADLAAGGIQTLPEGDAEDPTKMQRLGNKQLLAQNVDYAIDMFLIYVLTLSIFPGFLSEDTGSHSLGTWYALVLIAMYNVWDLIGRYVPCLDCLKLESRKWLMVVIVARFLLVPAFYFTAKYGDQGWMIMLTSFLGLTNGYLTVCVLTTAPKGYKGPEQNALGNLLVVFLVLGIFAGVTLDWLWLIGKGWYPLVLFAMYNVWDLIGRYVPCLDCLKLESRKWLMVVIVARFLLVPAFYFTAKYGDQGWMIMLTSFLGLTQGYLTVCVLTTAPKGYKGPEQNALGNLLVVFLLLGIFAGVTLDWLWLIGKGW